MTEQTSEGRAGLYADVISAIARALCQGGTPKSQVQTVKSILSELHQSDEVQAILGGRK